jgi:hypothetical protein
MDTVLTGIFRSRSRRSTFFLFLPARHRVNGISTVHSVTLITRSQTFEKVVLVKVKCPEDQLYFFS